MSLKSLEKGEKCLKTLKKMGKNSRKQKIVRKFEKKSKRIEKIEFFLLRLFGKVKIIEYLLQLDDKTDFSVKFAAFL